MFNPLHIIFKYSDTVSFETSGDIEQAISRLSRVANKPLLQAGLAESPSLVGSVTKEQVRLHKVRPLFGNIFKPIFFGKFHSQDHKVYLRGTFEMGSVARLITWIPIVFCLVIQLMLLPSIGSDIGNLWPTAFLGIGILMVVFSKMPVKGDVEWIKHQIESALR